MIKSWLQRKKGQFHGHTSAGVAVSHDGIIYVTDTINQCIQYFNPDGNLMGLLASGEQTSGCSMSLMQSLSTIKEESLSQSGKAVEFRYLSTRRSHLSNVKLSPFWSTRFWRRSTEPASWCFIWCRDKLYLCYWAHQPTSLNLQSEW